EGAQAASHQPGAGEQPRTLDRAQRTLKDLDGRLGADGRVQPRTRLQLRVPGPHVVGLIVYDDDLRARSQRGRQLLDEAVEDCGVAAVEPDAVRDQDAAGVAFACLRVHVHAITV